MRTLTGFAHVPGGKAGLLIKRLKRIAQARTSELSKT